MKITGRILTIAIFIALNDYINAQDNTTADFKPSGNLWGQIFGDWANKFQNDTLSRGGGNVQYRGTSALNSSNTVANTPVPANVQTNGFQMRRIYLGYDYKFAPNFAAQVVLANEQNVDGGGKNTMYVKYANVKCLNIFKLKNTDLVLGQYLPCAFATLFGTEPSWAYRSVERTIIDMHNIDGGTDLGASLQGKAWSQKVADSLKPTFIGYYLQVGNNNAAVPNASNFKKGRVNVYVAALQQKLTIGLYGDYLVQQLSPYKTSNMTMKAYASYTMDWFRIGFEFFQQTNKNSDISIAYANGKVAAGAKNDTTSGTQMGWSVFASGRIIKNKLNIFARYDMYNPDTKYNTSNVYSKAYFAVQNSGSAGALNPTTTFYNQSFINAGLDWTPTARFHIMPNIWVNNYKTMMSTTLPGGTTEFSSRVQNDKDVVYRITFCFFFNANKKVSGNGMNN
ncbi:MAG: hypothetical protein ACHQHP_01235 [Bacteroidia bacterium]